MPDNPRDDVIHRQPLYRLSRLRDFSRKIQTCYTAVARERGGLSSAGRGSFSTMRRRRLWHIVSEGPRSGLRSKCEGRHAPHRWPDSPERETGAPPRGNQSNEGRSAAGEGKGSARAKRHRCSQDKPPTTAPADQCAPAIVTLVDARKPGTPIASEASGLHKSLGSMQN